MSCFTDLCVFVCDRVKRRLPISLLLSSRKSISRSLSYVLMSNKVNWKNSASFQSFT